MHLARNCFDLCEGEGRGGKKVVGFENQRSSDFKKWSLFVRVYVGTWFHSSRIRCDPWSHNSEVLCAQVLVTCKCSFCPPPLFSSVFRKPLWRIKETFLLGGKRSKLNYSLPFALHYTSSLSLSPLSLPRSWQRRMYEPAKKRREGGR